MGHQLLPSVSFGHCLNLSAAICFGRSCILRPVRGVPRDRAVDRQRFLAGHSVWSVLPGSVLGRLHRRFFERAGVCGHAIMVLWGRQVMLEIPTFAFLLWSAYFFVRYLDSARPRDLYLVIVFVVGAACTKQPAIFIALVYLLTLY